MMASVFFPPDLFLDYGNLDGRMILRSILFVKESDPIERYFYVEITFKMSDSIEKTLKEVNPECFKKNFPIGIIRQVSIALPVQGTPPSVTRRWVGYLYKEVPRCFTQSLYGGWSIEKKAREKTYIIPLAHNIVLQADVSFPVVPEANTLGKEERSALTLTQGESMVNLVLASIRYQERTAPGLPATKQ